jgi:hypothetical protein
MAQMTLPLEIPSGVPSISSAAGDRFRLVLQAVKLSSAAIAGRVAGTEVSDMSDFHRSRQPRT